MAQDRSIFEYENFREYLKEKWNALKRQNPKFSLRYFARVAGFKSHNFLKHVLSGKSNLSSESIEKFSKALKLNKEESIFFKNLVFFNQAKTSAEKQKYGEELIRSRSYRKVFPLSEAQFNYFKYWYFVPVREFVKLPHFKEDYAWIAQNLIPKISPTEVERAIQELLKLGLLERDASGKLRQSRTYLSTSDEVSSSSITHYHREMMKRASESIDVIPREKRDISNMTLTVSEPTAVKIKEMIQNFRKEIVALVSKEDFTNSVYQLNFQMFPIVLPPEKEKNEP